MTKPKFRRTLRLETLESRELLTAGGPSAEAQYMLELINLARTNPAAAAQEVTSNLSSDVQATLKYYNVDLNQAKQEIASSALRPPVAWSDTLAATATGQSQYQADNAVQTHIGANGSALNQRLDSAGYTNRASDGENAYAYSQSVGHAMEAFLIDWGVASKGHRNNLLQPTATADQFYREVGIGIVNTNKPGFGPKVITQDFARQNGSKADLLGVAFNSNAGDGQYHQGEGQGNVEIDATNLATGQTKSTLTWDNGGGYQIPLDPGSYSVSAKVGNQVVRTQQVTIQDQNVKVDYNLSQAWQGSAAAPVSISASSVSARQTTAPAPAPAPTPIVVAAVQPTVTSTPASVGSSWGASWTSWTAVKDV